MSFIDKLIDRGQRVADIYADVRSADRVSNDGLARVGVRPETIADQTSVGVPSPAGFNGGAGEARINIAGIDMSQKMLTITAVLIAGIVAVRAIK